MKWASRFIKTAELCASWSKDPSTQVGAVIVDPKSQIIIATGFNGFPREVYEQIPIRWQSPLKHRYVEHAERNAIFNAARHRGGTEGCMMYLNWAPDSICEHCARAIIQAGIVKVIGPAKTLNQKAHKSDDWREGIAYGQQMFAEAGIELVALDE